MEIINNFEIMAHENLKVAKQEKLLAKESKLVDKSELRKATLRGLFVDKELDLARIKRLWAKIKLSS